MAAVEGVGSEYRPLAEVRQDLRVKWYRCPIEGSVLRELSRRSDLKGFVQAGGHVALFAASGALTYFLWLQEIWIAFVAALFVHGTIASFWVGVAGHELSHGSVFKTKWLNKLFLYTFSTISWFDPFDYSASHTFHHRYTLHPEGDREVLLPISPTVGRTFLLQLLTINLSTPADRTLSKGGLFATILTTARSALGPAGSKLFPSNAWLTAVHEDQPRQHMRSAWFSRWQLLFHAGVVVVSIATGQWVWILLLTVAASIGNWARHLCVMPQHCGLMDNNPDFRKCVRSMTMIWPLEFLYWNMNWHLEHHMYAGIPCYNLKKLHRAVAHDMPEPRTLIGAWREMFHVWSRQQEDPDYQFDTPLPEGAGRIRRDKQHALEASIGDLAPKELA